MLFFETRNRKEGTVSGKIISFYDFFFCFFVCVFFWTDCFKIPVGLLHGFRHQIGSWIFRTEAEEKVLDYR